MSLQHFFVGGKHLGSREVNSWRRVPGLEIKYHNSLALFCPKCGEIWGRLLHEGASYTQCIQRFCRSHGDGRLSSPLSWADTIEIFQPDWPPAAIRWEFESTLRYAERQLET